MTGHARHRLPRVRLFAGALGGVSLLAGLWAALILLGLHVPTPRTDFAEVHGPLMVLGFLGTLIALERAVAVGHRLGYLAPGLAGLGALMLVLGLPLILAQLVLALGGLAVCALYVVAARRQPSVHLAVMAAGAVCWVVAVLGWAAGRDVADVVPWLAGFLVLTIGGERLELARVVRVTGRSRVQFVTAVAVLAAGLAVSLADASAGVRLAGAGLLLLAAWLAVHDVARRTVRQGGVTRYMAVCLIAGYGWLAIAGVLWMRFGTLSDGPAFDAMLHALFLGFVIGMVFAHAPVIVPAVFRVAVPYRPRFYAHVALLHTSLIVRLAGGDLAGQHLAWQVGGVLNEIALLGFVASTCAAVVHGRRHSAVATDRRRRLVGATTVRSCS